MSPAHPASPPTGVPPSQAEQRQAFGTSLRRLRDERGISIGALSQTTRISIAFITALEQGQLEKLPGQVFGRGFVRSISKSYGLSGDDLVAAFEALWDQEAPRSVLKVQIKSKPVPVRSERMACFLHNAKSLVRRGILVKVAVPIVFAGVAIYWLAVSGTARRMLTHVTERRGATSLSSAKPLHLQEVPPPGAASTAAEAAVLSTASAPLAVAAASVPSSAAPELAVADSVSPAAPEAATTPAATSATDRPEAAAATAAVTATEVTPGTGGDQVLELTVTEPVRIRMDVDHGAGVTKELRPDTYRLTFSQKADMLIYNASAVKIAFNGKQLGSLGSKGRVRRLSFQAQLPAAKKM